MMQNTRPGVAGIFTFILGKLRHFLLSNCGFLCILHIEIWGFPML